MTGAVLDKLEEGKGCMCIVIGLDMTPVQDRDGIVQESISPGDLKKKAGTRHITRRP